MENIKLNIEENLKQYFNEITEKVTNLAKKSKKKYFAFIVQTDTDTCKEEGWAYQINYKSFDDSKQVHVFEGYGYKVINIDSL